MKPSLPNVVRCLAVVLAGAILDPLPSGAAVATGDPVEIPAVLTLTGTAAFLGSEESQAFPLIENYVNANGGIAGRPVKFHIYDEASNPTVAVQIVNSALGASKVPVFVGPVLQASCNATAPLFKSGPVAFCIAPSDFPDAGGYRFSANASVDDAALLILRYLRLRGLKRVAVITATDAAGQVLDKSIATAFAAAENKDMLEVSHDHFSYTDISVAAQFAHVKAASAQVVIGWVTGTPLATLLHGYRDAGLDVPFVAGSGSMVYVQMDQYKSILPKELLFPGIAQGLLEPDPAGLRSRDAVRRMQSIYTDAFASIGVRPDFGQMLVWDCSLLAVEVLRHVGPGGTPEQAREYLANLHDWAGVNGVYDFRGGKQRGVGINAIAVVRWDPDRNQFVAVSNPGGVPNR
jgi:branched-chain amino acid transport system substrate-binding protein